MRRSLDIRPSLAVDLTILIVAVVIGGKEGRAADGRKEGQRAQRKKEEEDNHRNSDEKIFE